MSANILVVEDSSAMRAFVRAVLEDSQDVEVQEAESGFEALRLLPRGDFDLVIVDINMPDINGLEFISFMRKIEKYRETPVVIMSTEASPRDRSRGMSLGANAYLAKPFTSEELLETLEKVGSQQNRKG